MTDSVRIASGDDFADIGLVGAGIWHLVMGGRDVIPLDSPHARKVWFSGKVLAPWPNRLQHGRWNFEGKTLQGVLNDPAGHAHHGLVYATEFEVLDAIPAAVTLGAEIPTCDIYPFKVRVEVEYALDERGLTSCVRATNRGQESAPIALGIHPYFPFAAGSSLEVAGKSFCELDELQIPTGRLLPVAELGLSASTSLDSVELDHCLTELKRDGDGRAHTTLRHADGSWTDIWQDENARHTQMFIKRDFAWAAGKSPAIGIEPQTAPTNAFNSGMDLIWLAPGAATQFEWGVTSGTGRRLRRRDA